MTMEGVKQTGNEADDEYTIKPQASTPQLDTSNWPLLLKNYDKRKSSPPYLHLSLSFVVPAHVNTRFSALQFSSAPATSPRSPPAAAP